MEKATFELICKEYGLELIDSILTELAKMQGLDRFQVIRHAYDFLSKECESEVALLLSDENNKAEYTVSKEKLTVLLAEKTQKIKDILDIENLTTLIGGE